MSNVTSSEKIDLVKQYYKQMDAEYKRESKAIYEFLDPQVQFHFSNGMTTTGPDEYWAAVSQFITDEVEVWHVLEDMSISASDGDIVTVGFIDVRGKKPDGEVWAMPGSSKYRVVNGKIVEAWIKSSVDI